MVSLNCMAFIPDVVRDLIISGLFLLVDIRILHIL